MRKHVFFRTSAFFVVGLMVLLPLHQAKAVVYPSDPMATEQWYLDKVGAYDAWNYSKGSRDVIVAVIDSGVDIDHADLKDNLWKNPKEIFDGKDNDGNGYTDDIDGWNFIDGNSDPRPDVNDPEARLSAIHHGTLIAGIIGAVGDNGIGIAGLSWNVKIMPLRVLNSSGDGDVLSVVEAIRYAIAEHADIINLSFVGPSYSREMFLVLQDAYRAGILVVAAVGNDATSVGRDLDVMPLYPVCHKGQGGEDIVMGITAVDKNDKRAQWSSINASGERKYGSANYGADCVDISAPGVSVFGAEFYKPSLGYDKMFGNGWSGTSLAAPMVSGVAAIIKAIRPEYRAQELHTILEQSVDNIDAVNPGFEGKLGKGRLNARRALELAVGGSISVTSSALSTPFILWAPASLNIASVTIGRGDGSTLRTFEPYGSKFRGGVNVTSGDVNGDGKSEIITGAGSGGGPQVRIFDNQGKVLGGFFAYDKLFRGGVNVLAYDLDNDGIAEIITAPAGKGTQPRVKIFKAGREIKSFLAFPSTMMSGVNIGVGDVSGGGDPEIIVAPSRGITPEVRVYSREGEWQRAFMAFPEKFLGGVSVTVADIDSDGKSEIITGAGPGGGPQIQVFDGFGRNESRFFAYDKLFRGGVNVGIIKL